MLSGYNKLKITTGGYINDQVDGKKTGIFAAGVAFSTAGIKILTSKDAKLYTNCTAVLRCKGMCNENNFTNSGECYEDIYQTQQINEDRQQLRKW